MLTIFHAPRTRSLRIVWLCEEMGVPYKIAAVDLRAPSPEYLSVNPFGAVPALKDGDLVMVESIAMMMYIMGKYGPTDIDLKPTDPAYGRYLQFLLFGESGMAMYCNPLVATKYRAPEDKRQSWTADYLRSTFATRLEFTERELGDSPYIAGERFTAADISVGYTVGIAGFAADIKLTPRLAAYHERLTARPAYQRMLKA
jgi:glutathione S-transferase